MMNLQITGKKMTTPIPVKKEPLSDPFLIQQKALLAKPAPALRHRVPSVKPYSTKTTKPQQIQLKKQSQIKRQQIQTEKKVETQPISAKVEQKKSLIHEQSSPKQEKIADITEEVTIRYNHYKQKFPIVNGILSFLPIEQKYGFADVFKGNFQPIMKRFRGNEQIMPLTIGRAVQFSWKLQANLQYKLQISEDEEEQAKREKIYYKAPVQQSNCCPFKKNSRFDELTQMMKQMDPSEYGSAKHRQLLEQRDLQDILFS